MNTWAPLFSKIVDSSLWDEDDFVVKIFLTMLAKKDADQVVRGTAYNIAQWAKKGKEEARVIEALKTLSSPDRRRLEKQPFDGRRIEKVDGGYLILNGQYYEDMMRLANRREYKRVKQAEYRKRTKRVYETAHKEGAREAITDGLRRANEQPKGECSEGGFGPGSVSGEGEPGMEEGSGGASEGVAHPGTGEGGGKGDNQEGSGAGGVQAEEGAQGTGLKGWDPNRLWKSIDEANEVDKPIDVKPGEIPQI